MSSSHPAATAATGAARSPLAGAYPWERPLGATPLPGGLTEFRVWAPHADTVSVRLTSEEHPMADAGYGVYEVVAPAKPGDDYFLTVAGRNLPDPCSRWQPEGLRGPSRIVAPSGMGESPPDPREPSGVGESPPDPRDPSGMGESPPDPRDPRPQPFTPPSLHDLIIYELHVGTFSAAGTFHGAIPHLAELAELGVTAIELMPIAEFPGARGWGYDGVYPAAAQSSYGGPPALARLVAAAHRHGLAMILDFVPNHIGASGAAALEAFGPYFTAAYETPWGRALNYDGADCDPVREWICQAAEHWVGDVGIDGLRLDALHAIVDCSPEHIAAAITRRVHAVNPRALVIAESGMNDPVVIRPAPGTGAATRAGATTHAGAATRAGATAHAGAATRAGATTHAGAATHAEPPPGTSAATGWGCDAAWADDFHHALHTVLTEDRDGYYVDFGSVAQLAKAFHRPHVHDGGYSRWRRRRYGAPAEDVPAHRFVVYAQNHDQVGNRALGDRLPAAARPLAAFCTLLSPFTPLLFMGEEYGELAPFQFFSDHIDPEIAEATRAGRRSEFATFAGFGADVPDPQDPATFDRSKLSRGRDAGLARLYRELITARRRLPRGTPDEIRFDERARWLAVRRGEHELVCNFGTGPVDVPCDATTITLTAGGDADVVAGSIRLSAMAGALVR